MTTFTRMNVLIYDRHPLVGDHIKIILSKIISPDNIITSYDYNHAFSIIINDQIDLLILDDCSDEYDGFNFLRMAKLNGFSGRSIYISSNQQSYSSRLAHEFGANGYTSKLECSDKIVEAIELVMHGHDYFDHSGDNNSYDTIPLSNREAFIIDRLLKGDSNTVISRALSLSPKTISTYKKRILNKYGVSNIFELINIINANKF